MVDSSSKTVLKYAVNATYGAGNDALVIKVAQDYYYADVQFRVLVDGKQVGGIYTVSATTNSGQYDTLTLLGDWGLGNHTVKIDYINGYYNAQTGEDSNLAIGSMSMNGVSMLSAPTKMYSAGQRDFGVTLATVNIVGTSGADKLIGTAGDNIITGGTGDDVMTGNGGHDTFVVNRLDGRDTITDFAATGSDSDVIRLSGYAIGSFDALKTHMVQQGSDTFIRLESNSSILLKNVKMTDLTAANFDFTNVMATRQAISQAAGTGADKIVIKLSQDLYVGDNAKFVVSVDGKAIGGTFTTSALYMSGQQDTLTLSGNWGTGNHTVGIAFLNDANNAVTGEDRNLFIESASYNGTDITGVAKQMSTYGYYSFVASAPVVSAPVVVTKPVGSNSNANDSSGSSGNVTVTPPSHDIFNYTGGTGAKTITGFATQGDDSDVLRISGFGLTNGKAAGTSYTSFDSLKSHIVQVGADTVISLSSTDVVTLKNVQASTLSAANFSFLSKLDGAMQVATNGNGWIVFNNTWGSGDYKAGEYSMTATYDSSNLATGTTFTWDYGAQRASYNKILGYPSVMFGSDTFNNAGNVVDPAKALPVQIANLDKFTTSFNVAWGGDKDAYDVSYDIWLTNKPSGDYSNITNEVMIWLHAGNIGTYGNLIGTYSDGTYSAKIYHTGTYTALVPDKDYAAGTVDIADVLKKLQSLGIVSSNEYVNQIDLGAEPIKGSGSLTINSLTYDITSHDANGIVTVDHADGGVTTVTKTGTAKADVLSADGAKIATLIGGAGNDTFLFTKGQTGAVTVSDFHTYTTAAAEHDLLKFAGYGSGATLVHDSGDAWSIHYTGGVDHITLHNVTNLSASDYIFV